MPPSLAIEMCRYQPGCREFNPRFFFGFQVVGTETAHTKETARANGWMDGGNVRVLFTSKCFRALVVKMMKDVGTYHMFFLLSAVDEESCPANRTRRAFITHPIRQKMKGALSDSA